MMIGSLWQWHTTGTLLFRKDDISVSLLYGDAFIIINELRDSMQGVPGAYEILTSRGHIGGLVSGFFSGSIDGIVLLEEGSLEK